MVRSMTKRGMPRPFAILLAALLALYFVPLGAFPASAVEVGNFEIEGDLVDSPPGGAIDWFNLGPGSPGFNTGVDNVNDSGQDTTTFKGASKEFNLQSESGGWPNWQFGTGNATGKSDFGRWATYDFVDDNDHVWFFLGFDRGFGTGTAKYAFELNQLTQSPTTDPNPDRSQGDIRLIVFDQGNGVVTLTADAQNPDVGLYVWDDPDQAPGSFGPDTDNDGVWVKVANTGVFAGASNTGDTPVAVPSWWTGGNVVNGALPKDTFLEFGIDLTSFGAVVGCPSAGFSAVNARSITGTGGPGTLVDYLEAIPVTIPSNCANLVINKEDADGNPLGGATFEITPNPLPDGTPGSGLSSLIIFDDSNNNTTVEPGTNYDDPDATAGKITLPAVVPDVEYTITEIAPPAGYIGETGSKTVTPEPFGGGAVTFTNTLGSVKFFKTYEGPNEDVPEGATFLLERDALDSEDPDNDFDDGSITVQDNGTNDANNTLGVIKVNDLLTGDYRLTETAAPMPGWIADGDTVLFTIPGANNTADVELQNPTFSNPRATYPLTVRKVAADDGALIEDAVFNLYRESNGTPGLQIGGDTFAGTCTTGANGECTVNNLAWGHDYYWYEVSVPAPYNLPDNRVLGPIHLNADGTSVPGGVAEFEDPESVIVTSATNGSLPTGSISDSATLTGIRQDAGGTITFRLWDNNTCAGDPIFTSAPVAVSGPGTYGPVTTTVSNAGDYFWIATYSGDDSTGTRGVAGECGDEGETSTVVPARPGIVTVVPDFTVTLSGQSTQLTDSATLSGASANATGSITFRLYGPFATDPGADDCTEGKLVGTVGAVETFTGNGTYTSQSVTVTQTGFYTWRASYSGDANNESATHPCGQANETVEVLKAEPTVTTDAQQDEVQLGSLPTSLTDKATLSGATADATGSISFNLYGPFASDPGAGDCTAGKLVGTVGTVEAFAGNGTYTSMPVVVTDAGFYTWVATYSGDDNNESATHECGQAVETTLVTPAQPAISTTAGDDQVIGADGATLADTAHLSGATADATGTITYRLYGPFATDPTGNTAVCTAGNLAGTVTNDTVDGNGNYVSPGVTVTETGYYVWVATYGGDSNNASATHACGDASEVVRVTPRQPVITTQIVGDATRTLGASGTALSDTATLSEATSDATGTISFQLYGPFTSDPGPADCTEGTKVGAPVTVTVDGNGTYTSPTKTVTAAGYYTWVATYSGDDNNNGATHECGQASETVLVTPAPTELTTDVVDDEVQLAPTASLQDTATLSGATVTPPAGGTITFRLYGPFGTDPTDPEGDATVCVDENLVSTVGTTGPVSGPGTYTSQAVTVTEAGFYVWVATYSGDANNLGSTHGCGDANEVTKVTKAGPTITTQVPSATARLAPTATLTDTATLSGATADATGTITFRLYGPFADAPGAGSCTEGSLVGSRVVTVDGPGTYSPVTGITVGVAGFYTWVATYSGDANNESATHPCGQENETVEVLPTQGTITTDALDRVQLSSGDTFITDQATLSGVTVIPPAGGSIEFKVYGPFATAAEAQTEQSCTSDKLVGGGPYTVAVTGPGTYNSPQVRVTAAGFYVWVASYSGDANNEPATHPCGQVEETTVVDRAQPVITTQVSATELVLGEQASVSFSDQATLSGATADATGTISFRLFGPGATVEAACAQAGAVQGTVPVNGNGTYQGPTVSVSGTGFYSWVATYSGDANNESATHACGLATETVRVTDFTPTLVKIANPPTGSTVQPGDLITYSVTVGNTGDAPIEDGVLRDILPGHVVVDQASVTASGGTFTPGGVPATSAGTITWLVDLAPGATRTFTYNVTVDFNAPELATLVNVAEFFGLRAQTTHRVPEGDLNIVKEVSPVAGNGVVVEFGDRLTYTLTVSATGALDQPNVVVTDFLPGRDPARPSSGETTYVAGSAKCIGAGTCTVSGPNAAGLLTWNLGEMAAGTTRQVTFQVTIDDVPGEAGEVIAVDILNAGAVRSDLTPTKPSNEVITPVSKVLPVKVPKVLPKTGSTLPIGPMLSGGLALLTLGVLMVAVSRRRRTGSHRA